MKKILTHTRISAYVQGTLFSNVMTTDQHIWPVIIFIVLWFGRKVRHLQWSIRPWCTSLHANFREYRLHSQPGADS